MAIQTEAHDFICHINVRISKAHLVITCYYIVAILHPLKKLIKKKTKEVHNHTVTVYFFGVNDLYFSVKKRKKKRERKYVLPD